MKQDTLLESKPLREKIADKIRADIIKGVHEDGERLVEPKLAKSLGISRTPIREALRQLETEGFIEIVPRKGAVVKALTIKDIDDIYAVKASLEGLAARQATENLKEKDIERLRKINQKFSDIAYENPNVMDEYLKYNIDFHNIFIMASENQKILEILDGLSKNFQRLKTVLVSNPERAKKAVAEHNEIIEAFASKDPELVEMKVRWHIENAWEFLKSNINNK
ncbi:GntR family transcriptional regulator [Limisalsivibrio acetivorans]|uniref:GntR family transcriptional regulator n=1 Tax=Limisalsivibrio acetivorans TaxID=1304888 RepID=UPI0003B39723|nr:GntR family transcriptional regulator [Limisalsivibrio acetivorans]